jgi:O-acetyl-ADP-ribose deacetylase (regulator of RNase III)
MLMFKALIGDLFESQAQTLVNTVNCVGVMGKGVALEFKKRFPAMFEDYVRRCERKGVRLGEPYLFRDASGRLIVNFPTKDHWRSPSRLQDIEAGLDYFVGHAAEWGVTSMALPPLGCGNGGLEWSEVGPLIYRKLHDLAIDVEVYAPYGTPKHELTADFLAGPSQMSLEGKGRKHEKLNANWVALMEVLRGLDAQPYANPVGRTIFQKICYVVTEMGVPTGFDFGKGHYGPFSEDVKLALRDFANRNWLKEEPLGRMVALRVSSQYETDRSKFADQIKEHSKKIDKTIDLFSRIKSTEQAEEVMTVLYASRQLKRAKPSEELAEQQLYDFILDWKKSWNSEEKKHALAVAIRNLVLLGWMRIQISEAMIDAA